MNRSKHSLLDHIHLIKSKYRYNGSINGLQTILDPKRAKIIQSYLKSFSKGHSIECNNDNCVEIYHLDSPIPQNIYDIVGYFVNQQTEQNEAHQMSTGLVSFLIHFCFHYTYVFNLQYDQILKRKIVDKQFFLAYLMIPATNILLKHQYVDILEITQEFFDQLYQFIKFSNIVKDNHDFQELITLIFHYSSIIIHKQQFIEETYMNYFDILINCFCNGTKNIHELDINQIGKLNNALIQIPKVQDTIYLVQGFHFIDDIIEGSNILLQNIQTRPIAKDKIESIFNLGSSVISVLAHLSIIGKSISDRISEVLEPCEILYLLLLILDNKPMIDFSLIPDFLSVKSEPVNLEDPNFDIDQTANTLSINIEDQTYKPKGFSREPISHYVSSNIFLQTMISKYLLLLEAIKNYQFTFNFSQSCINIFSKLVAKNSGFSLQNDELLLSLTFLYFILDLWNQLDQNMLVDVISSMHNGWKTLLSRNLFVYQSTNELNDFCSELRRKVLNFAGLCFSESNIEKNNVLQLMITIQGLLLIVNMNAYDDFIPFFLDCSKQNPDLFISSSHQSGILYTLSAQLLHLLKVEQTEEVVRARTLIGFFFNYLSSRKNIFFQHKRYIKYQFCLLLNSSVHEDAIKNMTNGITSFKYLKVLSQFLSIICAHTEQKELLKDILETLIEKFVETRDENFNNIKESKVLIQLAQYPSQTTLRFLVNLCRGSSKLSEYYIEDGGIMDLIFKNLKRIEFSNEIAVLLLEFIFEQEIDANHISSHSIVRNYHFIPIIYDIFLKYNNLYVAFLNGIIEKSFFNKLQMYRSNILVKSVNELDLDENEDNNNILLNNCNVLKEFMFATNICRVFEKKFMSNKGINNKYQNQFFDYLIFASENNIPSSLFALNGTKVELMVDLPEEFTIKTKVLVDDLQKDNVAFFSIRSDKVFLELKINDYSIVVQNNLINYQSNKKIHPNTFFELTLSIYKDYMSVLVDEQCFISEPYQISFDKMSQIEFNMIGALVSLYIYDHDIKNISMKNMSKPFYLLTPDKICEVPYIVDLCNNDLAFFLILKNLVSQNSISHNFLMSSINIIANLVDSNTNSQIICFLCEYIIKLDVSHFTIDLFQIIIKLWRMSKKYKNTITIHFWERFDIWSKLRTEVAILIFSQILPQIFAEDRLASFDPLCIAINTQENENIRSHLWNLIYKINVIDYDLLFSLCLSEKEKIQQEAIMFLAAKINHIKIESISLFNNVALLNLFDFGIEGMQEYVYDIYFKLVNDDCLICKAAMKLRNIQMWDLLNRYCFTEDDKLKITIRFAFPFVVRISEFQTDDKTNQFIQKILVAIQSKKSSYLYITSSKYWSMWLIFLMLNTFKPSFKLEDPNYIIDLICLLCMNSSNNFLTFLSLLTYLNIAHRWNVMSLIRFILRKILSNPNSTDDIILIATNYLFYIRSDEIYLNNLELLENNTPRNEISIFDLKFNFMDYLELFGKVISPDINYSYTHRIDINGDWIDKELAIEMINFISRNNISFKLLGQKASAIFTLLVCTTIQIYPKEIPKMCSIFHKYFQCHEFDETSCFYFGSTALRIIRKHPEWRDTLSALTEPQTIIGETMLTLHPQAVLNPLYDPEYIKIIDEAYGLKNAEFLEDLQKYATVVKEHTMEDIKAIQLIIKEFVNSSNDLIEHEDYASYYQNIEELYYRQNEAYSKEMYQVFKDLSY